MHRKTFLAGGIFIALAIASYSVLKSPEKGTRTGEVPRPVPKLAGFDTLAVTKDGKTTVIKKEGAKYKVVSPVTYPAEEEPAKQAFEALQNLEFDGIVTDQKSKHGEFEVGDNGVRVAVKKGDQTLADLRVGKVTNNVTMVRAEGKDEVWKAVGFLKHHFDRDTTGWRDKSITTFEEKDAEKIELVSKGGGRVVVSKAQAPDAGAGGEGEWRLVESTVDAKPLDPSIPSGIISSLYSWKASDFADGATLSETGLDAPETTVTVELKGGKSHKVLVGKAKTAEDYYVKTADNPQIFLIKKYNLERVNRRPIEFRDKTMCDIEEAALTEIQVSRAKDPFALVKKSGKTGDDAWKVTKPAGVKLDTGKASAIASAFNDWKAITFAQETSPKTTGLAKPSATIVARTGAKGPSCVLRVGGETADKQSHYVEKVGQAEIFEVPNWSLDRVLVKIDDLKKS